MKIHQKKMITINKLRVNLSTLNKILIKVLRKKLLKILLLTPVQINNWQNN